MPIIYIMCECGQRISTGGYNRHIKSKACIAKILKSYHDAYFNEGCGVELPKTQTYPIDLVPRISLRCETCDMSYINDYSKTKHDLSITHKKKLALSFEQKKEGSNSIK